MTEETQTSPENQGKSTPPVISADLLKRLVCPISKTALEYNAQTHELLSHTAKLAFPIRNGIPIMLVEEARSLEPTASKKETTSDSSSDKPSL